MDSVFGILFAVLVGLSISATVVGYERSGLNSVKVADTASEMKVIADAAQQYISANYATIEAAATAATPAVITVPMLESTGYLPSSLAATNPYLQTWQVQVLQPTAGVLQALVISVGGERIPEKDAPSIAAQGGQEGGFIPYTNQYGAGSGPATAQGSFGNWSLPMTGYSNPGAGHMATLLAFNNGNLQNDYLYRVAVPGQPKLNQMATNLDMGNNNLNNANEVNGQTINLPFNNGGIETPTLTNAQAANLQFGTGADAEGINGGPGGNMGYYAPGAHYFFTGNGGSYPNGSIETGQVLLNGSTGVQALVGTSAGGSSNTGGDVSMASPSGAFEASSSTSNSEAFTGVANTNSAYAYIAVPDATSNNAVIATDGHMAVNTPSGGVSFWADNNGTAGVNGQFQLGSNATQGAGCSSNGAIAANSNGTGQLMSCFNGTWTPALSAFTTSYQMGVNNNWRYYNTSSGPMFVSSYCNPTPGSSGYVENVTLSVLNQGGGKVSQSQGQVQEGGSDANFSAAPSASAIVPSGYSFIISGQNMSCSLMVTE